MATASFLNRNFCLVWFGLVWSGHGVGVLGGSRTFVTVLLGFEGSRLQGQGYQARREAAGSRRRRRPGSVPAIAPLPGARVRGAESPRAGVSRPGAGGARPRPRPRPRGRPRRGATNVRPRGHCAAVAGPTGTRGSHSESPSLLVCPPEILYDISETGKDGRRPKLPPGRRQSPRCPSTPELECELSFLRGTEEQSPPQVPAAQCRDQDGEGAWCATGPCAKELCA